MLNSLLTVFCTKEFYEKLKEKQIIKADNRNQLVTISLLIIIYLKKKILIMVMELLEKLVLSFIIWKNKKLKIYIKKKLK